MSLRTTYPAGAPPFYVAALHGDPVASITGPVPEGTWIIAVEVDDLVQARSDAERAGGTAPGDSVDIATLGRFHRLHDPAGAEIHAVQSLPDRGPTRVNETGAWLTSTLHVETPDYVAPFYSAVFGWRTTRQGGKVGLRSVGATEPGAEARSSIDVADESAWGLAAWSPSFCVDDVQRALDTVRGNGGAVLAHSTGQGGVVRPVVAGPDGARFLIEGLSADS